MLWAGRTNYVFGYVEFEIYANNQWKRGKKTATKIGYRRSLYVSRRFSGPDFFPTPLTMASRRLGYFRFTDTRRSIFMPSVRSRRFCARTTPKQLCLKMSECHVKSRGRCANPEGAAAKRSAHESQIHFPPSKNTVLFLIYPP